MHQTSDRPAFVYTNYIKATPEQVWQGLTDPALTNRYWRHATAGGKSFPSDWKKGSTYDLVHEEVGLVVSDPAQVILESDPYHRLAYTWHTFTPEWAAQVGMDDATADSGGPSPARGWRSTSKTSGTAWSSSRSPTTASRRVAPSSPASPKGGLRSCPA